MLTRTLLLIEGRRREPEEPPSGREQRREKSGRGSRVLYHIGKRPPFPRPAHSGWARLTGRKGTDETPDGKWERPGREPTSSGVFLTNNPVQVATQHGVMSGHVYAYRVPHHVIRKSGGLRKFDHATELLVPHDHWHHVEFLGKHMDKADFHQSIRDAPEEVKIAGNPFRRFADEDGVEKSKKQTRRDKKAQDIKRRQQGRKVQSDWVDLRRPLLCEALRVRRQSVKERMAKRTPSATFGAARSSKWLWQQLRKKWSKLHPQYIYRKGKLIFVPPEKRRQLKSKIKGRVVLRAKTPGSGHRG